MRMGELLAELSDDFTISSYDDKNYKWFEISGMKFWKDGDSQLVVQHTIGNPPDNYELVETTIDMDKDSVIRFIEENI